MPHRDVAADGLVADAEVGQVRPHGRAEVDLALLDEPHHRRRRERLGDRRDRKDRVRGDRQRVFDVRHAEARESSSTPLATMPSATPGTPYSFILLLGQRGERVEARIALAAARNVALGACDSPKPEDAKSGPKRRQ